MKGLPCAIIVASLLGCGGDTEPPEVPAGRSMVQRKIDNSLQGPREQFAFKLKNELLKGHSNENQCFSPLSIEFGLCMLLNGVKGDSADRLRTALSLDKQTLQDLNTANSGLVSDLAGGNFTIADSIWMRADIQPKPDFVAAIHDGYQGEFFAVQQFDSGALSRINSWASDKTRGRIARLLDELHPSTTMMLVNALTFDGKWSRPFESDQTTPEDFKTAVGNTAKVPTMHQKATLACGEFGDAKALRLDYLGGQFSMLFILPPHGTSAAGYLAGLTPDGLHRALGSAHSREVDVALPKFELRSSYTLQDALTAMGMRELFTSRIDLSGVAESLKSGQVVIQAVHQTYMKVDEEGTVSAASSAYAVGGIESTPPKPDVFHADRPFVYALIHNQTRSIIFLGLVNDPRGARQAVAPALDSAGPG